MAALLVRANGFVYSGHFVLFWLCFDCFRRLVHCWYSLGLGFIVYVLLYIKWLSLFLLLCLCYFIFSYSAIFAASMWLNVQFSSVQYLWRLVHQWIWMYQSSKTVKNKKMTIGVAIVTCLHRVRRIHKAAQTPLPRETSITRAWAVATARRPWTGLTLCVYMDVHASGSRSLPYAATLFSTYWWCLQLV